MNNFIKFTFDIFAHIIPGLIILVAFSLLTISFKPQPVEVRKQVTAVSVVKNTSTNIKESETKRDYGMVSEIFTNLENTGTGAGIVIIILAYIVGFGFSPLGKTLSGKIGPKLWPKIFVENDIKGMHISDKYILIREYSPANFEYVERWNMYSSLSNNLAVGCLVFFIVSMIQIFVEEPDFKLYWIIISAISVFLFFVFIKSSRVYVQWAGRDLNSAISALKLRDKGNN